jgi:hypothetical protein
MCILLTACSVGTAAPPTTPVAGTTSTPPEAASAARITAPTVPVPTAPGSNLAPFKCADASGGTAGAANVVDVRVAEQAGYDRFVIQFDSKVPSYTVKRQAKPVFKSGGSGQSVTLLGSAGVLVQVHSASGAATYTGATDFKHPEFLIVNEAQRTEDFEGYLSWGLGLSKPACMRAFTLSNPPRLVIDLKTT